MSLGIDLYTILLSYAKKEKSACIEVNDFMDYLKKYIEQEYLPPGNAWSTWGKNTHSPLFWDALSLLISQGKCELITDNAKRCIMVLRYNNYVIQDEYQRPGIFPTEKLLGIVLPEDQVKEISVENLGAYLDSVAREVKPDPEIAPQQTAHEGEKAEERPNEAIEEDTILRISFPQNQEPILLLESMLFNKLLETSLHHVRIFLRKDGNIDYVYRRLSVNMTGVESSLDLQLKLLSGEGGNPDELFMGNGGFTHLFWMYFCTLIKQTIPQEDPSPEQIALKQALYILEQYCHYYRLREERQKNRKSALVLLNAAFSKPPYLYTKKDVFEFTDNKGTPLLKCYSTKDLEAFLNAKTSGGNVNELPELLSCWGPSGEQCVVRKDRVLVYGMQIVIDARVLVKDAITKRWLNMLKQYRKEASMQNERDFDALVLHCVKESKPHLSMLTSGLSRYDLTLIENALPATETIPRSLRLINDGKMMPLKELLLLNREKLLQGCYDNLSVLYSLPIYFKFMAFVTGLGKKKKDNETVNKPSDTSSEKSLAALKDELIPKRYTLDSYLANIHDKWNKLIDNQARQKLFDDVNGLVRTYLGSSKGKRLHINTEAFEQMAEDIIAQAPVLQRSIREEGALRLYMKLYMIKLMESKSR